MTKLPSHLGPKLPTSTPMTKQAAPSMQAPSTTPTTSPTATKKADGVDGAGVTTQSAALKSATLGLVASKEHGATSTGKAQASLGARLLQGVSDVFATISTGTKAAIIGFAMITAAPTAAHADTVFLDHNDAPMEIKVAQQLARSKGEPFVLVRPDAASLDSLFAKAERGEINIRHLILSGHSTGLQVWGSGSDGKFHQSSIDDYRGLKAKYPKAFESVEHVTFMSCYAGRAGNSAQWSGVFHNARAISGFYGSGPSKTQPAAHKMLKQTELEVRKLEGRGPLSPQQALIMAKKIGNMPGTNVTKFAMRLDGAYYSKGEALSSLQRVEDAVTLLENRAFTPYFEAQAGFEAVPTNHARSELRDYYNALQSLSDVLPADDYRLPDTRTRIETTIRLIYFDAVVGKFQEANKGVIDAAAKEAIADPSLGITIPADLTKLNRGEVLKLYDKLGNTPGTGTAIKTLRDAMRALKTLSPSEIPANWIG